MNRMARRLTWAAAALALGLVLSNLTGCGTPGAPSPPSLKLPVPVTDLDAVRAGSQVTITWTNPKRDTDKVALKGYVTASICRLEASSACAPAGTIPIAPGTKGTFVDTLPAALAAGSPRSLAYFVELKNRRNRSAGPSNAAVVLAGESPSPVAGLSVAPHKDGVALHWSAGDNTQSIRLYRILISAPQPAKKDSGPLAAPKEPAEQKLLIDSDMGRALDPNVSYGATYEYRAQRIARLEVRGVLRELPGELSAPVRIEFQDIFPPSIPTGLAAVATAASPATPASIDLSWLPATDRNLAGYIVYRRESDGPWQRISPPNPAIAAAIAPAFHDAQVAPGHTYRYAVASISLTGHESPRSPEAEETVPPQ